MCTKYQLCISAKEVEKMTKWKSYSKPEWTGGYTTTVYDSDNPGGKTYSGTDWTKEESAKKANENRRNNE